LRSLVGDLVLVRLQEERILFCTNAYTTRFAARSSTVRWRRKAACRRRGIWRENSAYQETPY
jgi:hypothetical protein